MNIDVKFARHQNICQCGNYVYWPEQQRVFRGFRYALRCTNCNKFFRYASDYEKSIINARINWLEDHKKEVANDTNNSGNRV